MTVGKQVLREVLGIIEIEYNLEKHRVQIVSIKPDKRFNLPEPQHPNV